MVQTQEDLELVEKTNREYKALISNEIKKFGDHEFWQDQYKQMGIGKPHYIDAQLLEQRVKYLSYEILSKLLMSEEFKCIQNRSQCAENMESLVYSLISINKELKQTTFAEEIRLTWLRLKLMTGIITLKQYEEEKK